MKRFCLLLAAALVWCGASAQDILQPTPKKSVAIGVFVTDQAELVPPAAASTLSNKMMQIVTANGMGANNSSQFFITSLVHINDKQVVGGAPTRVMLDAEVVFYIVDSATNKVFETTSVAAKGVGANEIKAYTAALKSVQPRSPEMVSFVQRANEKIVAYYESQIDNIIKKSDALAKTAQYEAALFELSAVPDVCERYDRIAAQGVEVYQKMIDESSQQAYAKAKTTWAAGQSYAAASEAAGYLATVSPYASCYPAAEALATEIKQFVASEHAYERKLEEEALARERKLEDETLAWLRKMEEARLQVAPTVAATSSEHPQQEPVATQMATDWQEVGEAYGENLKSEGYSMDWFTEPLKRIFGDR